MIAVSLVVFVGVIRIVLRHRTSEFPIARVILLPPPMLLTVFAPPIVLGMRGGETALYLVLSFLSAPFIHVAFALFLGWDEYMPFLPVPSLAEILA